MTEHEAKEIIRNDPAGDIFKRLEAIEYALEVLGSAAKMGDIYKWAENDQSKKVK